MSCWTDFLQSSNEYEEGVVNYLDKAFATRAIGDQISCPCKVCYNRFWHHRDKVYDHLIANGIEPGSEQFHYHERTNDADMPDIEDNMDGLLNDIYRDVVEEFPNGLESIGDDASPEAKKFYKLVEDGKQELYPGCKTFSKLSFLIRLYLLKCLHGITNNGFSDILELILELIPEAKLPKSFNEAKKIVKDLGLHYDKIDACCNNCMLY